MASLHLCPTNPARPGQEPSHLVPKGLASTGQLTCALAPRDPATKGRGLTCSFHTGLPRDGDGCSGQSPTAPPANDPLPPPSPRTEKWTEPRPGLLGEKEWAHTCPWPRPQPTQVSRDPHSSALSTLMAPDQIRPQSRSPTTAAALRSATSESPQLRPPARPRAPPRARPLGAGPAQVT